jgi:hypothetical protein
MLRTREEAKRYLRGKYGNRIRFSQTLDREIPDPEIDLDVCKIYNFIVLLDGRVMGYQIDSRGNKQSTFPTYPEGYENSFDDWE